MRTALASEFRRRFGTGPEFAARAPGRVNLIGEHTDYNEGLVLPCAIDRDTVVLVALRPGPRVRVFSRERGGEAGLAADGARALREGDLAAAGACPREGMRSLRDDFAVGTPEQDALCEIADALPGVYGSRLTGAGFGGCTLHLVEPAHAGSVADALALGFGRRPPLWSCIASDGASPLPRL